MSESNLNFKRRESILEAQPNCIFCGGRATADTVDHIPPKIIFKSKQWPEGFEFSACKPCNNGSKLHDYFAGFMARFSNLDNPHGIEKEELDKFIKSVARNYPEMLESMLSLTTRDKRIFSRETGLLPRPGETYADLPIVSVTPELNEAMAVQAAKITKALHYKHTGIIVPLEASIRFRWFTNANEMRGDSPIVEDLLRLVQPSGEIKRNNATLKNQFDYKYAISPESDIAVYVCMFGTAFGFLSFLTFDPEILEQMLVRIREDNGFSNEGFIRTHWPPIFTNVIDLNQ